jgi:hypothetical protein
MYCQATGLGLERCQKIDAASYRRRQCPYGKLKMDQKETLTSHFDASFSAIMLKLKQFFAYRKKISLHLIIYPIPLSSIQISNFFLCFNVHLTVYYMLTGQKVAISFYRHCGCLLNNLFITCVAIIIIFLRSSPYDQN